MENLYTVHFKIYRANFFIIISDSEGLNIFSKSSGCLGYKHIEKRSLEAFNSLVASGLQKILSLHSSAKIRLLLEGFKKDIFREIYKQFIQKLKHFCIELSTVRFLDKVVHNGCRKKKIKM